MTQSYIQKILKESPPLGGGGTIRGNKFNKLQNTKLIYRNMLHYYNYKVEELEVKKTIAFAILSKRIKYLGINLRR